MKKVFIIHGFEGAPNGGWRPWLMGELNKHEVYACALSMPDPENPICDKWVAEIARHVERDAGKKDADGVANEIYLVGHSLGVPAIMKYLESEEAGKLAKAANSEKTIVAGAVLISGPFAQVDNERVDRFLNKPFDFDKIETRCNKFLVIHGDNDKTVPRTDGELYSSALNSLIKIVKNGGHLSGGEGWFKLPEALDGLLDMMDIKK